ncbi:hypothetical protein [Pacificimonas flava]|uniref:Uncharacterized protein n=1 Tax=Pacificimonas flava TaxID=1234595 RepID=M2TBX1_9SPHN|nr:hypothetical protein [Pacificimonas flava]EMD84129.1 hypothetical protein C725_0059 [Pacificimonas flava]MBB5279994.1 hypothetical protein [Pacificimonas flava]
MTDLPHPNIGTSESNEDQLDEIAFTEAKWAYPAAGDTESRI